MTKGATRRTFIGGLAALAAGPACTQEAPASREKKFSAFDKVTLGKTGIVTTRLGFGSGVNSWMHDSELLRRRGFDGAVKLMRSAYDRGIRFFDLADSYGSHRIAAAAFKGLKREGYTLCTKYWWRSGGIPETDRADAMTSIDRYLKELNTDYLDIVQLHCVDSPRWQTELAEHLEALARAKKAGKIRAHGCSFHSYGALAAALASDWLEVAHVRLNPFGRNMTSHPERVMKKVCELHDAGRGIVAMKVLGVGSLKDKPDGFNRSLRWNLNSPGVDVLNIGFTDIAEIDDIVKRIAAV